MKTTLSLLFVLLSYIVNGQTHVLSYVLTVEGGLIVKQVTDSTEVAVMPTLFEDHLSFSYHTGYYYFRIEKMTTKSHHVYRRDYYYGIGTFLTNPYSIRIEVGHHTTLWIIPLMFHRKSNISDLRAFVFTDDPRRIHLMRIWSTTLSK